MEIEMRSLLILTKTSMLSCRDEEFDDSDWHEGSLNSDNTIDASFSDDELDDSGLVEGPVNPGMTSDDADHDANESDAANHVESEIEPMNSNDPVDAADSGVDYVDLERKQASCCITKWTRTLLLSRTALKPGSACSARKKLHSL